MPEALTFEESERRALLMKEWTRYKAQQYKAECVAVAIALNAQQVALQELREESEELYQLAIQVIMQSTIYQPSKYIMQEQALSQDFHNRVSKLGFQLLH